MNVGKHERTRSGVHDIQAKLDEQKWIQRQQDLARRLSTNQRHAKLKAQKEATLEYKQQLLKEKKTRRWKTIQSKITFEPPSPSYYSRTPFKPGVFFWIALEQALTSTTLKLQVNVPDLLLCHKHVTWMRTESRMLKVINEFKILEFYKGFKPPNPGEKIPAAVMRVPSSDGPNFKAIPMNFAEFSDTIQKNQVPSLGMIQRYVKFNGTRPAIVRLFFIKQTKDQRATHAWSVFNTTETVNGSYHGKFLVDSTGFDSVDIVSLQGVPMEPYILYAKHIVELLELRFSVRIEEMVLDFLRGEHDTIWLLGCQGFRIDEAVLLVKEQRQLLRESYSESEILDFLHREREQRLAEMHCKLCLLPFKSQEIRNQLPYKTLLLFKERTQRKKKGPLDLSHLRIVSADYLTHSIRICEICYCLVLAEIELMKAEMMLARVLDVPMEVYDVMNPKVYTHPSYLPSKIHQWRVLLYFQHLETLRNSNFDGFYLRYFIFGEWFTRKLPANSSSRLNFAGLHYFFALKSEITRETCHSLDVEFEISATVGSKCLLHGSIHLLKYFNFQMEDQTGIHQQVQLHMFDRESVAGRLVLAVGLACDREVKVKELQSTITRFLTFYIPERTYFSSDNLPEEWMEMFQPGYKTDLTSRVMDSSEEANHMYTPVLPLRHFTPTKSSYRPLTPSASCKHLSCIRPTSTHLPTAKLPLKSQRSTATASTKYDEFVSPMLQTPRIPSAGVTRGISPILEHQADESIEDWELNFPTEDRERTSEEIELAEALINPVDQFLKGKPAERYTDQLRRIVKKPPVSINPELLIIDTDTSLLPTMTTIELLPRPSSGSIRHSRLSSAHRMDAKHRLMRQTYHITKN